MQCFRDCRQPQVVQAKQAEKRLNHDDHAKIVIYQGSSGWGENFGVLAIYDSVSGRASEQNLEACKCSVRVGI